MKPDTQAACEAATRPGDSPRRHLGRSRVRYLANEAPDLVRFYADMREELEAMASSISDLNPLDKDLSYSRIPACFDAHGIQNIKLPGYGLVGLELPLVVLDPQQAARPQVSPRSRPGRDDPRDGQRHDFGRTGARGNRGQGPGAARRRVQDDSGPLRR